ncbi:hypothetical protein COO60DRAFT_1484016 [Scenedesmus sp. NREL 46B-D3]|nr:hypothetical protein COO60DRAFT_1484016 [Scenedesmus sp. NREL 46B-D3]
MTARHGSWCGCRLQLLPEVLLRVKLLLGLTMLVEMCRLLLLYRIALPDTSAASAPCSAGVCAGFAAACLRRKAPSCMPAQALKLVHHCIALALRHPLTVVTCKLLLHNPAARYYKETIFCLKNVLSFRLKEHN